LRCATDKIFSKIGSLFLRWLETLIFYGPPAEAKAVRSLLQILDVPYQQVEISAGLYEYQAGTSTGSAVIAAVSALLTRGPCRILRFRS
jgi:type II secretory pathway component GspD/PulD (secretin)